MYIPTHCEEHRVDVLHDLIRLHPLASLVVAVGGDLSVAHIPMVLQQRGQFGTLVGHVARANSIWRQLAAVNAVAIFQGPQAYITPNWYASKQLHGKVVPTWNYAVVHAHGRPRAVHEPAWLLSQVSQMTVQQEAGQSPSWKVSDAPADYIERLLSAIVGIEMPIEVLRGSWKVGQKYSPADRRGVVAGLQGTEDSQARAMAELVQQRAGREVRDE